MRRKSLGDGRGDFWGFGGAWSCYGGVFKKPWSQIVGQVVQDSFPVPVEKSYYVFYQ